MVFPIEDADRREQVALIDGDTGGAWTYGELGGEVRRRRERLRAPGKSLLFLFCRNDRDSVAWYLAALEAGHAVALLNGRTDERFQQQLMARYRPEWILCPPGQGDGGYAGPDADGLCHRRARDGAPIHPELALLLSTSGSTGSPKFARLTRRNIAANAASIRQALGITAGDVPVAHLPLHYSYGLSVLNSHLLAGAALVLTSASIVTPGFWEMVRRHRVDSFSGVPFTYQMLRRLDLEKLNAPSLRIMTQAGGKLDTGTIAHFHETMVRRNGTFRVMYGQTEATARISILPAADLPARLGSAGLAIPDGRLAILTDSGELAERGTPEGELIYHGPNVMLGYALERSDLARGDELRGCLHTGDRARLDEEGYVYILGRVQRDAKLFGLRVNLDELEAMVKRHGPAAAVAGANRVIFFCQFGGAEQHGAIRAELSASLRIHQSAFEFRRVAELPVKETGKIDYEALLASV